MNSWGSFGFLNARNWTRLIKIWRCYKNSLSFNLGDARISQEANVFYMFMCCYCLVCKYEVEFSNFAIKVSQEAFWGIHPENLLVAQLSSTCFLISIDVCVISFKSTPFVVAISIKILCLSIHSKLLINLSRIWSCTFPALKPWWSYTGSNIDKPFWWWCYPFWCVTYRLLVLTFDLYNDVIFRLK